MNGTPQNPGQPSVGRENIGIAAIMAAILFLASVPQIYGFLIAPADLHYTGLLKSNLDALSYLAKIRQGIEGRWLYENRYTTEPHPPALLFTFYLTLGHVARTTGLSAAGVYQIARVLCGLLHLLSADHLIRTVGWRGRLRLVALCMIFLGSGLDWAPPLFGADDSSVPSPTLTEGYCFQSMANYPHFSLATSCMMIALAGLHRYAAGDGRRPALLSACIASFVLAWVHPRLLLTVGVAGLGAAGIFRLRHGRWNLRWILALTAVTLAAVGPAVAILLSLRGDPVWAWTANPVMTSPMPVELFFTYGLLWPLAAAGAWKLARSSDGSTPLLLAWLAAGLVLPYAPYDAQRRLWQGYDIPLAMAAAWLVAAPVARRASAPAGWRIAIALAVCSVGTFVYAGEELRRLSFKRYPNFIPADRMEAMRHLDRASATGETVIASLLSGVVIPSFTANRVVVGHWAETYDEVAKERLVAEFFDAATTAERRAEIIGSQGAGWLLYSPFERELGVWDPAAEPGTWREEARFADVVLYQYVGRIAQSVEARQE